MHINWPLKWSSTALESSTRGIWPWHGVWRVSVPVAVCLVSGLCEWMSRTCYGLIPPDYNVNRYIKQQQQLVVRGRLRLCYTGGGKVSVQAVPSMGAIPQSSTTTADLTDSEFLVVFGMHFEFHAKTTAFVNMNFWGHWWWFSFVGSLVPLFRTSSGVCPKFPTKSGFLHLHTSTLAHYGLLRSTSDATPANLLAASMAVDQFFHWLFRAEVRSQP